MFPAHLRSGSAACRRQERDTLSHSTASPCCIMSTRLHIIFNSLCSTASYWHRTTDEGLLGVEVGCSSRRLWFKGRAGGRAGGKTAFLFLEVTRVSGRAERRRVTAGGRAIPFLPIQLQRSRWGRTTGYGKNGHDDDDGRTIRLHRSNLTKLL